MKLWKSAAGALKDKNSIWLASLLVARQGGSNNNNPNLQTFVIKATSHDKDSIDYKNAQRVFSWIRNSPTSIEPLRIALANRMEKTRSWVVALKGLILMHGIFCCNIPAIQSTSRLPFDLSNFRSSNIKYWAYDHFVRAYYAFLDQRSSLNCSRMHCAKLHDDNPIEQELNKLVKLQSLLDCLLQVKPKEEGMRVLLILEAMDCVMIEIFDIYSKICNNIANIPFRICTAGKAEAALALKIIQKATEQGKDLTDYFHYCHRIGVLKAPEFPRIEKIPEEDIRVIERMINDTTFRKPDPRENEDEDGDDEKAIVVKEVITSTTIGENKNTLKTIITDKWEVFEDPIKTAIIPFEDDLKKNEGKEQINSNDPFTDFVEMVPRDPDNLPDLITF